MSDVEQAAALRDQDHVVGPVRRAGLDRIDPERPPLTRLEDVALAAVADRHGGVVGGRPTGARDVPQAEPDAVGMPADRLRVGVDQHSQGVARAPHPNGVVVWAEMEIWRANGWSVAE